MERSAGEGESPSRPMANRARSPLTEQTHKGRSSKPRSFTTRRRQGTGENTQRPTLNAQRPIRKALFPAGNLLHQRFKARIVPKIVEEWISRKEEQVAFVASRKAVLERFDGALFFA